jgi:hypothetical protein
MGRTEPRGGGQALELLYRPERGRVPTKVRVPEGYTEESGKGFGR